MNRQNLTYKLAVNHMADYSEVDFRVLRGVKKTRDSPRQDILLISSINLPQSWNWRLQGKSMCDSRHYMLLLKYHCECSMVRNYESRDTELPHVYQCRQY